MRKKLLEITDIKVFLRECEDRLKRFNYRDISFFMDTVRYLILIVYFSRDNEDIEELIGILNKYLSDEWKTKIYDHEEDFFIALNKELMDLLDEVGLYWLFGSRNDEG
jgi:argininosuccinate lyase